MYCPRCATANSDDTKFCRSCGANLALVPQAMSGRLREEGLSRRDRLRERREQRREERHRGEHSEPALAKGITQLIMGMGFLVVAAAIFFTSPGGRGWWWAMLFPAFSLMGGGVARIVSAMTRPQLQPGPSQMVPPPARNTGELPPQQQYNPLPPPSVTEGTTRHLDPSRDRYNENG